MGERGSAKPVSRISATFKRLRWEKEAAFIPYVPVGYPSLEVTRQLVPLIGRQGADLVEIGVLFSDQLAPDTRVDRASDAALLADCLSVAADARRANEVPLVLTSPYDPIREYGLETLVADCAAAGVDGLFVPDLPINRAGDLKMACAAVGVDLIFFLHPGNADEHIRRVAEMASGFIYCLSLDEFADGGSNQGPEARDLVDRIRQHTNLPLVVGFSPNIPELIAEAAQLAEGVRVVTAVYRLMKYLPEEEILYGVGEFIRQMKAATKKVEG
jgi:tryptophan synthase alpha chain